MPDPATVVHPDVQILSMILGFLGLVINAVMAYLIAKLNAGQATRGRAQAIAQEEVRRTLAETTESHSRKLDDSSDKLDALADHVRANLKASETVKILVNSNLAVQLKAAMIALQQAAERTGDPSDIEAAEAAEAAYRKHLAGHAIVDPQIPAAIPPQAVEF